MPTQEVWIIAAIFGGFLAYSAWSRNREHRWIARHYGHTPPKALSFGVSHYNDDMKRGQPVAIKGFLLLLPDRLVFHSRRKNLTLEINARRIQRVYHDTRHLDVDLTRSLVKVTYRSAAANDHHHTVAFKVPYPPQWIDAIKDSALSQKNRVSS